MRATPGTVRQVNDALILRCLMRHPGLTRAQLARETGLSKTAVSLAVRRLRPLLTASPSPDGRTKERLSLSEAVGAVVGVDVGGTTLSAALVTASGTFLSEMEVATPHQPDTTVDGDAVFTQLTGVIDQLSASAAQRGVKVWGIAVSVPGVIDRATGAVDLAPAVGWTPFPLAERLAARYELPVHLVNDVNAALWGELWKGLASEQAHVFALKMGTGVGAAVAFHGQVYEGAHGTAGELGYLLPSPEALRPTVAADRRGFGAFEDRVSGRALLERIRAADPHPPASVPELFQRARAGEPRASALVEEAARWFAWLILNSTLLLDLEDVILTGGLSRDAWFVNRVETLIRHARIRPVHLRVSELQGRASILGAVAGLFESGRETISFFPQGLPVL